MIPLLSQPTIVAHLNRGRSVINRYGFGEGDECPLDEEFLLNIVEEIPRTILGPELLLEEIHGGKMDATCYVEWIESDYLLDLDVVR